MCHRCLRLCHGGHELAAELPSRCNSTQCYWYCRNHRNLIDIVFLGYFLFIREEGHPWLEYESTEPYKVSDTML